MTEARIIEARIIEAQTTAARVLNRRTPMLLLHNHRTLSVLGVVLASLAPIGCGDYMAADGGPPDAAGAELVGADTFAGDAPAAKDQGVDGAGDAGPGADLSDVAVPAETAETAADGGMSPETTDAVGEAVDAPVPASPTADTAADGAAEAVEVAADSGSSGDAAGETAPDLDAKTGAEAGDAPASDAPAGDGPAPPACSATADCPPLVPLCWERACLGGVCVVLAPAATGTQCDDGSVCTPLDQCADGACVGELIDCADENPCTADSCDPVAGCLNAPLSDLECDDGNACTQSQLCWQGSCAPGLVTNCSDGNTCTNDACNPESGTCSHVPTQASCDDGDACTGAGACVGSVCASGALICACKATADCAAKDDGNPCNGVLVCNLASHSCDVDPATVVTCDASGDSACQANQCDAASGLCAWTAINAGGPCDADGSVCTPADACLGTACVASAALNCDDGNACTADACAATSGCSHVSASGPCSDGNACTAADTCKGGVCLPGAPSTCDDGNGCSVDTCDVATGACAAFVVGDGAPCDADASPCTPADTCVAGLCVLGASLDCSDGNACTIDDCGAPAGCSHEPGAQSCDDGNACTLADGCVGGACVGIAATCDDGNPCSSDACAAATGCSHTALADASGCGGKNQCFAGTCDAPPVIAKVTLLPANATAASTITCAASGTTDADGTTAFAYTYKWVRNGSTLAQTAATLAPGSVNKGDTLGCSAAASDGLLIGAAVAAEAVVIADAAPTVAAVAVGPAPAGVANPLTCSAVDVADADGDPVTLGYLWLRNGVAVGNAASTLGVGNFVKGDIIVCKVTAHDGELASAGTLSAPLLIANTPPSVASAALGPTVAFQSSVLTCSASGGADADGDPVTFGWSWFVNGALVAGTGSTLKGNAFGKGQSVYCVATPSDGSASGSSVTSNIVAIANSPPSLGGVALGPLPAHAGSALVCSATGVSDGDGDPVNLIHTWQRDGAATGHSGATLGTGITNAGEVWQCSVTPSDGSAFGATLTASTTIQP